MCVPHCRRCRSWPLWLLSLAPQEITGPIVPGSHKGVKGPRYPSPAAKLRRKFHLEVNDHEKASVSLLSDQTPYTKMQGRELVWLSTFINLMLKVSFHLFCYSREFKASLPIECPREKAHILTRMPVGVLWTYEPDAFERHYNIALASQKISPD